MSLWKAVKRDSENSCGLPMTEGIISICLFLYFYLNLCLNLCMTRAVLCDGGCEGGGKGGEKRVRA